MNNRKLRAGMIGGGIGAFIGPVHRMALDLDNKAELVGGAFSRDPQRSRDSAASLYLDPQRVYDDYLVMATHKTAFQYLCNAETLDTGQVFKPMVRGDEDG